MGVFFSVCRIFSNGFFLKWVFLCRSLFGWVFGWVYHKIKHNNKKNSLSPPNNNKRWKILIKHWRLDWWVVFFCSRMVNGIRNMDPYLIGALIRYSCPCILGMKCWGFCVYTWRALGFFLCFFVKGLESMRAPKQPCFPQKASHFGQKVGVREQKNPQQNNLIFWHT